MKLFIPIFLFGLLQITVFGQVPNQLLKFAESSIDEGNWPVAFEWAKQAYELDTTSFESQAIFAVCAYEIKEFALSSKLFAELNRKDLGKLAPDALFYLASANKQMGNYEDAEIYFRNYLKKSSSSDPYLKSKAKQEIKNCQWAKEYSDRVDSVFVYHLPEKFQNQEADILPRMMENELISYFKEKGVWNKQIIRDSLSVKTMNPEFLAITQYEDLCVGVSYKDNFPVLVELTMAADSSWKIKRELSEINSGESYIGMPYLTKIEELVYLFFVSNREGSIGKKDIWISRFQNGKWQKPFNAGKKVNTLDDEISPFFSEEKLFFSSSWYEGFGGWDIYYAEGSPGSFDLPINAGKPFNTNFNDWGYAVYSDKNIGFFSSDRPLNDSTSLPPCCTDLFGFTWQTKEDSIEVSKQDSLMVVITDLNMSLPIRLFFHNDEPNPRTTDTLSNFTYLETFDKYLDLKGTYITKLSEQEKENSFIEEEVNMFFENEVLKGKMKLMEFESQIESELK
ncbi:MAG: tetratricopeptide repeat protein, partial [Bacteroidota bacterium]